MWLWCSREQLGSMQPADPNWGSAFPTIAHRTWITTGQTEIITRYLKQLVEYIDSLEAGIKKEGLERIHTKYLPRSFSYSCARKAMLGITVGVPDN